MIACDPSFIHLAGPDLLSLEIDPDERVEYDEMPIETAKAIAQLSGLTRLDLCRYSCTPHLSAFQRLNLQELNLHCCPNVAEATFLTGTMTALQKLHISEFRDAQPDDVEAYNNDLADTESEGHQSAQQLHQLGQVLFSLPSLVQVSGECRLFTCAMAEGLEEWGAWKSETTCIEEWIWKKLS